MIADDLPDRTRRPAILALLAFAMLIVSLDQYIVVVALPDIGRDLGFTAQTLQAVVTAYAVASGGFLLLGGRTADLHAPAGGHGAGTGGPAAGHRCPAGPRPVV